MNYLAHVFLSGDDPELMIGNLLGDMLRNEEVEALAADWKRGVYLHRFIDSYTDAHPRIRQINVIFRSEQGKYAPVVTDIMLDHVLAKCWDTFHDMSYSDYCDKVYDCIDDHYGLMPIHAKKRLASMINGRWLHSYRYEEGMRYTYSRLARRARFTNRFELAFDQYTSHQEEIDQLFLKFFPEMIHAVGEWLSDES